MLHQKINSSKIQWSKQGTRAATCGILYLTICFIMQPSSVSLNPAASSFYQPHFFFQNRIYYSMLHQFN